VPSGFIKFRYILEWEASKKIANSKFANGRPHRRKWIDIKWNDIKKWKDNSTYNINKIQYNN